MEKSDERHHITIRSVCRMGGGVLVLLLNLSGCGNPASEPRPAATSPITTASTSPAPDRSDAGIEERQALSKPVPWQSIGQPNPKLGSPPPASPPLADAPRAPHSITVDSPSSQPLRDEAQEAQWEAWYAAARESSDVTVRLQALEQWAQQPGASLDPVTYALVDGDEQVRARAQALYEQQLTREATLAPTTQHPAEGPQEAGSSAPAHSP